MSLENEDQLTLDQSVETNHESEKKLKFSYTREFLLSLSELDDCKKLPRGFDPLGFDRSLLSEFEDASQDRQRISGNLSLHSFRRNEYGSPPLTRGELGNYSRGIQGRWDRRRSDRDSDSQADLDSDSGRHYGNQSRRSWQVPEHDGLLGSGSFPRPSGYAAGASAPRFQSNDHIQLGRTNEPYHPPRPYKAMPHSRRETNDSYNDETFGSSEFASEDREEEERKRRVSFELLRKEQHKAFQEKLKLNPEKRKEGFDITELVEESKEEKGLLNKSNEADEPVVLPASDNSSQKSSLPSQTAASRPLVPPGFTSTILERNFVTKTSVPSHSLEAGNSQLEGSLLHAKGSLLLNGSSGNQEEKQSAEPMGLNEQQHESMAVDASANDMSEKTLNFSSIFDGSTNTTTGLENRLYKASSLSEEIEAPNNGEVMELDAEKLARNKIVGDSNQGHAPSILDKLFGSAVTPNGGYSSSFIELHDSKADRTVSPRTVQSSKFAYLFLEEEKKQVDFSSSRPTDLLSLIQGGEKGGFEISDVKVTENFSSEFPFHGSKLAGRHMASNFKSATIESSEQFCNININKSAAVPSVLTCEDLEQSMLSEINEKHPTSPRPVQGWSMPDMRPEQKKPAIDGCASQHLLSLLQKGTGPKDMVPRPNIDKITSERPESSEGASTGTAFHNREESNVENNVDSGKSLTLETLFGTAFMKELQSVGAPGCATVDVSESHGLPLRVTDDDLLPSTVPVGSNRSSHGNNILALNQREQIKSDGFEEHIFGFDDLRTGVDSSQLRSELGSKHSGFLGSVDIRLPEEDSLITVNDPVNLQNFMPVRGSAKAEPEAPVHISKKLAAINSVLRDERSIVGGQEGSPFLRGANDMREPDVPFHNLNVQASSPQLHSPQFNQMGPRFHSLESHRANINSQMNFMAQEGIIHHDPLNHQFPANMIRPPFHHPSAGLTDFDPPPHHPMLQQMHVPGNLPPPHLLQGFPRGAPLPPHSNNQLTGFIQDMNPMQSFPFGHRQPNFAGLGMPSAPNVGRSDHPEALQRLIEMELRANSKQIPPFGADGQSHGTYGHELDMGFGYR